MIVEGICIGHHSVALVFVVSRVLLHGIVVLHTLVVSPVQVVQLLPWFPPHIVLFLGRNNSRNCQSDDQCDNDNSCTHESNSCCVRRVVGIVIGVVGVVVAGRVVGVDGVVVGVVVVQRVVGANFTC